MTVVWLHSWFIAATSCDGGEKHQFVPVSLSAAVRRNQWLISELDLFHCQRQTGGVPPEFCIRRPENLGSHDNISHCQPYCTKENGYIFQTLSPYLNLTPMVMTSAMRAVQKKIPISIPGAINIQQCGESSACIKNGRTLQKSHNMQTGSPSDSEWIGLVKQTWGWGCEPDYTICWLTGHENIQCNTDYWFWLWGSEV